MATEVPPIVIDITASDKSFIATFAKDKALLTDWAKASARAKLGADSTGFQDHIATAKTELLDFAKNVSRAKLGADAAPFWTEIAALRTTLDTMSPLDVRVDANTGLAMAKIAALRGDLASASIGSLLAGAAGGAAGGGGGGWGSVLAGMLGFGGRRRGAIPGLGALAGVGTLGGFAGLGSEHVIGTLGGLAGFAGAGALGGGLLGAGTLGVAGVGMGTDLAGIGQAAGDIKLTVQAQNALNQAIAVYGKNSIQAQQAQAQLNYTLSGFPKVAQGAIH
ncbi:MAG: hypothetical protein JWM85_2110, partial [Acidimicrobiaceae bacterium]|nr:hypothetical protein [Acidimicrobiaceae bacterium]